MAGYPAYVRSRQHQFKRRTSGSIVLTATAYAAVDTSLDVVLDVAVGDVVAFGLSGLLTNEAQGVRFDASTMNGATRVNPLSGTTQTVGGVPSWRILSTGNYWPLSGEVRYTIQAGDIDANGRVTIRLFYMLDSAAPTRSLTADTFYPLTVWGEVKGPQRP